MKFDKDDFVARPWKYLAIGFMLCLVATYARNPSIAEWDAGLVLTAFGMPLAAGFIGYFLLKRQRKDE